MSTDLERPPERALTLGREGYVMGTAYATVDATARLALAQHHGLPTRLLDWSFSLRVALHFSTYEEQWYDRDGAIWRVDVAASRRIAITFR